MPIHHDLHGKSPTTTERMCNYVANTELGAHSCSAHENVLRPGAVVPTHRHAVEEVIVCIAGNGTCQVGDAEAEKYRAGSVIIIPPNTMHTIENTGIELLRQISFFAGHPTDTEWAAQQGDLADITPSN